MKTITSTLRKTAYAMILAEKLILEPTTVEPLLDGLMSILKDESNFKEGTFILELTKNGLKNIDRMIKKIGLPSDAGSVLESRPLLYGANNFYDILNNVTRAFKMVKKLRPTGLYLERVSEQWNLPEMVKNHTTVSKAKEHLMPILNGAKLSLEAENDKVERFTPDKNFKHEELGVKSSKHL